MAKIQKGWQRVKSIVQPEENLPPNETLDHDASTPRVFRSKSCEKKQRNENATVNLPPGMTIASQDKSIQDLFNTYDYTKRSPNSGFDDTFKSFENEKIKMNLGYTKDTFYKNIENSVE